jgi:hypothetical protein
MDVPVKGGITVIEGGKEPLEVIIHRRPLRLEGNAHDISRLMEACKRSLVYIEQNGIGLNTLVHMSVPSPQDDEG